jgi:superfamily II DNA or RNA helicase
MHRTTHTKQKTGIPAIRRHQVKCLGGNTEEYRRLEEQFVAYCKEMSTLKLDEKKQRAQARIRASSMLNGMRAALGAAKVARTQEWAGGLHKRGRKGVVFCYHRAVAELLSLQLPGRVLTITGDTPKRERQHLVDELGRADFLVGTMDALAHGVNGLEKHAADVAFAELDYTHSKHEQSEGRLRRHGQKTKVNAYYLVAPDTYDEAMLATLRKKWRDAKGIVDGQEAARSGNFAEQVLMSIIAQRPWEKGGKVDWKATATTVRRGMSVQKPGKAGTLTGKVVWVNASQTSCRVAWTDGVESFEMPDGLRAVPTSATLPVPA